MITGVTLGDVVNGLDGLDDDHTIYADGPVASPREVVAGEPEDGAWPPEATGLHYFLEVDIAKEAVRVWSEWQGHYTDLGGQARCCHSLLRERQLPACREGPPADRSRAQAIIDEHDDPVRRV